MGKRLVKNPPIKYNLKLDASKFKLSSGPPFSGKYIYRVHISSFSYKWFYAPVSVLDMYFRLDTGEIIPVVFSFFIHTELIKELIVIRPDDWTSGIVYFQYFLTDSESKDFQIFDLYENKDFTISPEGDKTVRVPFPTYNFKFLFTVQTGTLDYNLQILQYFYRATKSFQTENKDNIIEKIVNTYYLMSGMCGGSGATTNPMNPFPSWHTYINIHNNLGADMTGCYMKVVSWL